MFGVCLLVLQRLGHLQRELLCIDSPLNNKVFVSTLENLLANSLKEKSEKFEKSLILKLLCQEIDEKIAFTVTTAC